MALEVYKKSMLNPKMKKDTILATSFCLYAKYKRMIVPNKESNAPIRWLIPLTGSLIFMAFQILLYMLYRH